MNFASRMESTGTCARHVFQKLYGGNIISFCEAANPIRVCSCNATRTGEAGKVQLSQATADLVAAAGKTAWIEKREGKVVAKGKGEVQTYFLRMDQMTKSVVSRVSSVTSGSNNSGVDPTERERIARLVSWNTDRILQCLKQIIAKRVAQGKAVSTSDILPSEGHHRKGSMPFDEVQEVIELPRRDPQVRDDQVAEYLKSVSIAQAIEEQAKKLVETIANMYWSNCFHNFEHATHVVMSVTKLLSRIVAPRICDLEDESTSLHDHTYGITSDPLTQFGKFQ